MSDATRARDSVRDPVCDPHPPSRKITPITDLPSLRAARDLLDALRALSRRPRDPVLARLDGTLADSLERRLLDALRRDSSGSVLPDGYRSDTSGDASTPSGPPSSRTEAHAVTLADPTSRIPRDRHHELTVLAARSLEESVLHLNRCASALSSIDDLTRDIRPTPRTCSHCSGKRPLSGDQPIYATGTVGDRLERSIALCDFDYHFVKRTAKPGTYAGRLASDEEIRHHDEHGRWRIRAA